MPSVAERPAGLGDQAIDARTIHALVVSSYSELLIVHKKCPITVDRSYIMAPTFFFDISLVNIAVHLFNSLNLEHSNTHQ